MMSLRSTLERMIFHNSADPLEIQEIEQVLRFCGCYLLIILAGSERSAGIYFLITCVVSALLSRLYSGRIHDFMV